MMRTQLAILILLMAGSTMAQNNGDRRPQPSKGGFCQQFDKNGDGKVSKEEFLSEFTRMDQNGDGFISEDEAPKGLPGRENDRQGPQSGDQRGGFMDRFDKDGDGKVSQTEFDGPSEDFSRIDRNGDGFITEDEAPKGPPPGGRGREE